jgi:hypothetical protein
MWLGVRIGEGCAKVLDQKMHNLNCTAVEVDEIWRFIGEKQANASLSERAKGLGDVWTFLSIDPQSKIMPSFIVGKRDLYHSTALRKTYPSV